MAEGYKLTLSPLELKSLQAAVVEHVMAQIPKIKKLRACPNKSQAYFNVVELEFEHCYNFFKECRKAQQEI